MDAQRQDHRRRLRAVIGNLVARPNLHGALLGPRERSPAGCPLRKKPLKSSGLSSGATDQGSRVRRIVKGRLYTPMPAREPRLAPASATFTATCMARWSDAVPIHVPCNGIA